MLPNLKKRVPYYKLTLPSNGQEVKYRPYINSDKEALLIAKTSEDDDQIIDTIEQIIPLCIHDDTKIDIKKLPYFDLEYLFVHIVGRSDGETFQFTVTCKDDAQYDVEGNLLKSGTSVNVSVKLEDIKVKKFTEHKNEIHLVDDISVILKYPTITYFQEIKNSKEKFKELDLIIACTEFVVDGDNVIDALECSHNELKEFYSGLTTKNEQDLLKFFETMPRLSHELKVINPNTGVETIATIEGIQDFF